MRCIAPPPRSRALAGALPAAAALSLLGAGAAAAAPAIAPVGPLAGPGQITVRGATVAMTQVEGTSASLLVGALGAVPAPAAAPGPIPPWAYPHLGTDRNSRLVVVYPRCPSAAAKSCDLWAYDVGSRKAQRLGGVNSASGETEGTIEHGAIAFTRWTAKKEPVQNDGTTPTELMYRPAGGPTRRLTTRGGQQIALAGKLVAQVRDVDPNYGECGTPTVEIVDTEGRRRTVRTYRCGMDGHVPRGLSFASGRLRWLMHGLDQGHYAQYVLATRRISYENADTGLVYAYAPLNATSGLLVRSNYPTGQPVAWSLDRISGLSYPRGG